MRAWLTTAALVFLLAVPPQSPSLDQVIQRTTAYVESYTKSLGEIVGEEQDVQKATWVTTCVKTGKDASGQETPLCFERPRERRLVSDFRTTPIGDEWFGARRVREVDGIEIDPSFHGRLAEGFDLSTPDGREKMQYALTFENARFNIGDFGITTNIPTFPLEVFRSDHVGAYSMSKTGEEDIDSVRTWKIRFEERSPGKVVEGFRHRLSGTLWIDPMAGRIYRADAQFDTITVATPYSTFQEVPSMKMSVRFGFDPGVEMLVPVSMDNYLTGSSLADSNLESHAQYSHFHRYETDVRLGSAEEPNGPGPAALVSTAKDAYSIKVDVPVVNVEVWATRNNQPVLDLKASDFIVTENGVEQSITNFSPVSTPFDVLMLFDRSGSMTAQMGLMVRAGQELIAHMRPQDRVGIASFGTTLRMLTHWTDTPEDVLKSFELIAQGGASTMLYRSVEHSLVSELIPVAGRRRALVLLTDGGDFSLTGYYELHKPVPQPGMDPQFMQMIDVATREHIPVYVVAVNSELKNLSPDEVKELELVIGNHLPEYLAAVKPRLEQLARTSGGEVLYSKKWQDILPLYPQIADNIGRAYSIGYSSTLSQKGLRQIAVRTVDKSLRVVQSRNNYTTH